VIATALSIIALPLHATGLLHGILGWIVALVYLGPVLYAGLLVVAALTSAGSVADRLRFMGVIAIMHFSWGSGFLRGFIRGAGNAVDTSRTES